MIPFRPDILQYAWVVPNLEQAARGWHDRLGVGPFLVNRALTIGDPRHRGQPRAVSFSTAVAQSGGVQIELIEQHDDGPSAFRDTVPAGETGFHHVAIIADDYDATLARYGDVEIAADGRFGDLRFAYLDTHATLGAMLEVLEDKPTIRAFSARSKRRPTAGTAIRRLCCGNCKSLTGPRGPNRRDDLRVARVAAQRHAAVHLQHLAGHEAAVRRQP